jgi:hypothetical protein
MKKILQNTLTKIRNFRSGFKILLSLLVLSFGSLIPISSFDQNFLGIMMALVCVYWLFWGATKSDTNS